jgi:predicted dehydrogenase
MAVRLVHIGVGVRGRHWLDIVAQHADFASVAYVDPNEQVLADVRARSSHGHGKFFTSFEAAMAEVQADAVLIASPTAFHAGHAVQALSAGLAVMVEKPVAESLAEAVDVVRCSRELSRPVMVAENYRFFPAERTLHQKLSDGMVGRVLSAICIDRRDQPSHTQGPWVKSMAHPFLIEIAVHHFDSFRYLFAQRPASMFVTCYNPPGSSYERRAATEALIELDGGLPIQYGGTMIASRYEYELWIAGENGDLWTDRKRVWFRPRSHRFFKPCKLVQVPRGDELPYPKAGTVSLLNQFRDAVIEGRTPETSADDNLWTLAMVEASIVSDRDRRKVSIDEVFTPALRSQAGLHPIETPSIHRP